MLTTRWAGAEMAEQGRSASKANHRLVPLKPGAAADACTREMEIGANPTTLAWAVRFDHRSAFSAIRRQRRGAS